MFDCDTCSNNKSEYDCSKDREGFPFVFDCIWFEERKKMEPQPAILTLVATANKSVETKPKEPPNPETLIYNKDKQSQVIFYSLLP